MKLHVFTNNLKPNDELLGTIDAAQTGLKDWQILEKLGINPASLKVEWCGDNGVHLAVARVKCILEIEMEVK